MSKISVIIKKNCDISAITSLLQQNNDDFECFIVNNSVQNIEPCIIRDARFKITKDDDNPDIVYETINKANGEYILLINSNDILVNDAIDNILHMIDFTNADMIHFKSRLLSDNLPEQSDTKCKFKYIFNKKDIMAHVFDDLSEFCFKKEIVCCNSLKSDIVCLTNILIKAKDMTSTHKICVIKQQEYNIPIDDIITNYEINKHQESEVFWKEYFKHITPDIITQAVKTNDKTTFVKFCKQIPLKLIPLRYRFICYILKKTNK